MAKLIQENILSVHHWNDELFSFKTTRANSFRFENGHFVMIGIEIEGKPLLRAYSIVSANYEDYLEFFSIKVTDGPLTSKLQHIKEGQDIFISTKPTGTLLASHLLPGKRLYLLSTGTGLAPFLSIIKDPHIYEQYDQIILTHGCRRVQDLAYQEFITKDLPNNEYFGDLVKEKLLYYPTVTREHYKNQGRITDLLKSGELSFDINLPPINIEEDRFMICGGTHMLKDSCEILENQGFIESRHGHLGHFVIERAFVEK